MDTEKEDIRNDYESLIRSLREEQLEAKKHLHSIIEDKSSEISQLKNEILKIRSELTREITEISTENRRLAENLSGSKKLADMSFKDNKILVSQKEDVNKENKILKREIELIEGEHKKVLHKSTDLKKRLVKMDKIVYGHSKNKRKAK